MIVLKATQTQLDALDGYRNGNNILVFVKDGNANRIVGLQVLDDSAFEPIRDQLNKLERIEYEPIPDEEE